MCPCVQAKGFEMTYLEKVPEVKDTVHKQSLLHHACSVVVENFPQSTDLYSEIGAITRSAKVRVILANRNFIYELFCISMLSGQFGVSGDKTLIIILKAINRYG